MGFWDPPEEPEDPCCDYCEEPEIMEGIDCKYDYIHEKCPHANVFFKLAYCLKHHELMYDGECMSCCQEDMKSEQ